MESGLGIQDLRNVSDTTLVKDVVLDTDTAMDMSYAIKQVVLDS